MQLDESLIFRLERSIEGHQNLATALKLAGKPDEAAEHERRAAQLAAEAHESVEKQE